MANLVLNIENLVLNMVKEINTCIKQNVSPKLEGDKIKNINKQ